MFCVKYPEADGNSIIRNVRAILPVPCRNFWLELVVLRPRRRGKLSVIWAL